MLYDERAGCPVNVLPVRNKEGDLLVYVCMRYHEKKKLDHKCYFEALIAALEHMFYREEGGRVDQVVLLLDFENWSPVTNVDLMVLKESMLIVFGNCKCFFFFLLVRWLLLLGSVVGSSRM